MLEKMQGMAQFSQVFDKKLALNGTIDQLLEMQKIKQLSNQAGSGQKILVMVGYVGHGIWRNQSMHTFNNSQKRVLDIESELRTCAEMPNVYVLGFFDSCRQELGRDSRSPRTSQQNECPRLVSIYRDAQPSQARPCSCSRLGQLSSPLENWSQHVLGKGHAEWDTLVAVAR